MIETRSGTAHIQCDFCSHCDEFDLSDYEDRKTGWAALISYMKREGWLARCWGTVWKHTCPICIEKDRLESIPESMRTYQHDK